MATREVTGTIRKPDGNPWAGVSVSFKLDAFSVTDEAIYPKETLVATDADGSFTTNLAADLPSTWTVQFPDKTRARGVVIVDGPPITLTELIAVSGIPVPITSDVQTALDAGFAAISDTVADTVATAITTTVPEVAVEAVQVVQTTVADGVGEWWVHPLATYQDQPYPRTAFGSISATGKVLACEFNHGTGVTRRYEIGQAIVDDHCVPSLWASHRRRTLAVWTNHNTDAYLHLKVGTRSGDLASLVTAQDHVYLTDAGTTSYSQVHHITHLSNDAQDTFWVFYRRTAGRWYILPVTIQQDSGAVSYGTVIQFVDSSGLQMYLTTADAHTGGVQVIRVAWGFNPSLTEARVLALEIDCESGAITDTVAGVVRGNTDGTNLPINYLIPTPLIPDHGPLQGRRLLFCGAGPDPWAVGYADWETATPDAATYKVIEWIEGNRALLANGLGTAEAAYHSSFNSTDGWQYTVVFKTPSIEPTSHIGLGSRYDGSSNGWWIQLRTSKAIRSYYKRSGSSSTYTESGATFSWGDTIGVRWVMDLAPGANRSRTYWSANPLADSPTWTLVGPDRTPLSAPTNTVTTALKPGVGGEVGDVPPPEILSVRYTTYAGSLLAGVDFQEQWTDGTSAFTDGAGRSWTLISPATIRTDWVTSEFGIAGERVGYSAEANYLAGMTRPNPSYDRAVIVARTDGTSDTVTVYRPAANGWQAETISTQPTTAGRLVRPYAPINGGPFRAVVTDMQSYGEDNFTTYAGNVRGVS